MKNYKEDWSADSRINVVHAASHVGPESFQELRELIRKASKNGQHVKAHGAGHSYSDITHTSKNDGILIDMRNLNQVLTLNKAVLKSDAELGAILHFDADDDGRRRKKPKASDYLVSVEAGINVLELNQALQRSKLAAQNLGSYNKQAFVGAMSTSTHGSGIGLGPMHDMVRSITLVATDGDCYRIEPKNGITDPEKFNDGDIKLVQDDDWFYSVVVSMGAMGVIYSVILQAQDAYWLEQNRILFQRWQDAKDDIVSKDLLKRIRHVEVYVNPNAVDGKHHCVVNKRRIVEDPGRPYDPKKDGTRPVKFSAGVVAAIEESQNKGSDVFKAIGDFLTDPIKSTIKGIENLFHFGQPGKDNDAENTSEDGKSVLAGVANCTPLWIRLMNCALKSSVTATYRNVSHEVLYLGVNGPDGFGIEAGFEYTTMEKVDEHLSLIFQFFKEKNAHGHAATTPMGIRFVKGTKAYLSPQYGRDTVMFEIGMLAGTNQGQDMLEDLQKILQKAGGRLHWGLHLKALDVAPDQLRRQYPMYDRWVKVYRALNSKGIFNNSFTERMELSVHPRA